MNRNEYEFGTVEKKIPVRLIFQMQYQITPRGTKKETSHANKIYWNKLIRKV